MRFLPRQVGFVGFLALAGLPTLGRGQHVGSEFRINTYTPDDQRTSPISRGASGGLIAADGGGNFVVVWTSDEQDGYLYGIFGQRYDSAGVPQGSEFRVNSYTTFGQSKPSVARAVEGGFVVVWDSPDGDMSGIFGQRFDDDGTAVGGEFQVNSYTTRNQFRPFVAGDASGNFVVVWNSLQQDGSAYGIFGQRYDSEGVPQGGEFRVNSYTTDNQTRPAVAMTPGGDFVVVWDSFTQDGDAYGTFGQRYDSQGVPQGSEFRVNSHTTSFQAHPSVTTDPSGNFVVVWNSAYQDGSVSGIFGQRYDSEGMPRGGEFRVNSHTPGIQNYPSVAADASGNFVVVWHSNGQDGSRLGVFAQRYDNAGVPQGGEFRVNTYTTNSQGVPSLAATGVSEFVLAWESDGQDGSGYGVFGQRIDFGGDSLPPNVTVTAPNGGERLYTGSAYRIQWVASDETGLSSFDVLASTDGGASFVPIAECQDVPGSARSCLWLAPGPPSSNALVRVTAQDTSGNSASDDSDGVFGIVSGTAALAVVSPNGDERWQVGSLQRIEWTHNLGIQSAFRIELDRDDDGSYEELIALAAPADGADSGRFEWTVSGPRAASCRMRASWSANLTVNDSSDASFQITLDPAEFQINTYTTSDQATRSFSSSDGHSVAADGRGNFVVVWESERQDGSGTGVFGQRYDAEAAALGSEFRVNSYTPGYQQDPSVAADSSGRFVVVWERSDQDGLGIFGQRYDSAGARVGGEFRVNTSTAESQQHPSVAAAANGNFVVVWQTNFQNVYGQRFDSAGNRLGAEFQVNPDTKAYHSQPSVASEPSGNFVVVWSAGLQYYDVGVLGQLYDSNGVPRGGEFLVSPISGTPSVSSDAAGNFVVAWNDQGPYGSYGIHGRRFDNDGVPLGPAFLVDSGRRGSDNPTVASDRTGNFVIAWDSNSHDGDLYGGVRAKRYDSTGTEQGGEFQVNVFTAGSQDRPAITATGRNRFVVAWTSDYEDGDGEGVFGRRLDFGGTITVLNPNANVKWRIGSLQRIEWTHNLGTDATFRIELDRDDDGSYEELIAAAAPVDSATKGSFAWTVTGPPSGTARVRLSWTDDQEVSDASDVTFQIRPSG